VQTRRAFVDNPRAVRRLAFTRVEVRGRVVSQDRRGHPSFEHRAAACRTAEIWLPRAGQRFAGQIQDHYGVPVHVSDLDGEAWLRDMCPDLPNIPAPAPPETLPEDSERVLREGIALMRGLPQTPQVRASIARGEPTLRLLERRPQASFQVELRGIPAGERDDMLVDLAAALPAEFPAFRVTTWRHHGDWAEVFVAGVDGTPRHALSRLDGWGHDRLVLRRAVVTRGSGRRQAGTRLWGGTLPGERRALRPSVRPNGSHSTW
jgi:hypothetical protein